MLLCIRAHSTIASFANERKGRTIHEANDDDDREYRGHGERCRCSQNVKIITANGKVTLRGPVKTEQERQSIETSARKVAGDGNVDDQVEVKK
jgi:hypothetical protein